MSGGFGTGKTTVLIAKTLLLSLCIPNNLGYLGRLDGKALRASTIQTLAEMVPPNLVERWNDQSGFIQFKREFGGSRIVYGDFKDLHDLQNIPLGFFAIDQMEEVEKEVWLFLCGRKRRRTPQLTLSGKRQYWVYGQCSNGKRHYALLKDSGCRICRQALPPFNEKASLDPKGELPDWDIVCYKTYGFGVCNPEGPSHWIFQTFPGLIGPHGLSTGLAGYKAFNCTIYDGLRAGFISYEDYVKPLEVQYASVPHMRDRYLNGLWLEATGLVYPGWRRIQHLVPRGSRRWDGKPILHNGGSVFEYVDPAPVAPTAVGWVMIEDCGCGCKAQNYWMLDEHYEALKPISYHAACIKAHRDRMDFPISATYMDSQAFSRTQIGSKGSPREDEIFSLADEYTEYDIFPVPNQKDWDAGFNRITEALTPDPKHTHPITGEKGAPHLLVMDHLKWFIQEIESYKWKLVRIHNQSAVRDEPQDRNDNHMDGLNGFLASRPDAGRVYIPEAPDWDIDLDLADRPSSHMGL